MAKSKSKRTTFSEFYKLGKSQIELDFVDVPVSGQDIELFIDPYSIAKRQDDWYKQCADAIYIFFEHLLDLIRLNKRAEAMKLLDGLHESNETRLGYSPRNHGAAIGTEQSKLLYESLRKSRAVTTGLLKDIEEVNLLIPGIDRDKVSDISTNIIKQYLIEYTLEQCELHGIIPKGKLPVKNIFNSERYEWESGYHLLPADMRGKPVILVPKTIVRIIPSLNASEYYHGYILDYLQNEHYNAGSSLCRTLVDGSVRPPTKRSIHEEITKVGNPREGKKSLKDFVYEFSLQNPSVLAEYEDMVQQQGKPIEDIKIEKQIKERPLSYEDLIKKLKEIVPGTTTAAKYHNEMIGILSAVFGKSLTNPKKEAEINSGIKRIDIRFNNSATFGFFASLLPLKAIIASYIFVECKNYTDDVENPEVDQLAMRFNKQRGRLGFLVCRNVKNRKKLIERCRAAARDEHGFIIPLVDKDIIALLKMKQADDDQGIDNFLEGRLAEIIN